MFSFQANEHSVCIHVALLLAAALCNQVDLRVVPFLNLEVPLKRKGPSYQADFVITRQYTYEQSHVVDLYYQETTRPIDLRQVCKLKYEHITLTSYSKMRVDLAAQVQRKLLP